jgi:hypothetical protein
MSDLTHLSTEPRRALQDGDEGDSTAKALPVIAAVERLTLGAEGTLSASGQKPPAA